MKRGAKWAAGLLGALFSVNAQAAEVEVLRQTGPLDKRFNIAVLGDGYRTEDQALLRQNAQAIIDYVFGVSPLQQYAQLFNVKLVHVVSNENGADNGSYGAARDTALDAHFNCDDIDRLLCIDDAKTQLLAAENVPEYNFAIVLVNDSKYGGSGGPVCVSSSNEQSFEVLAHELGHSLAGLADEYSYQGNQPACDQLRDCPEANATLRTLRDEIKWRAWIDPATPVPTPPTSQYLSAPGLFEGARYTPLGVYRPQQSCKMRDLNAPYCAVCSEQLVKSIWSADNVQMIEGTLPVEKDVTLTDCAPLELSVVSPPLSPSTYRYTWSIDGVALSSTGSSAELSPIMVGAGEHDVVVMVADETSLVRSDPDGLLRDRFSWRVTVARDDCSTNNSGGVAGVAGSGGVAGEISTTGGNGGSAGGTTAGGGTSGAGGAGAASGGGVAALEPEASGGALGGTTAAGGFSGKPGALEGESLRASPPPRDKASCGCRIPGNTPSEPASLVAAMGGLLLLRRRVVTRRAALG